MSSEYRITFSGKGHSYTEEEIALVSEVMRHADPLTQGPYQQEFERTLCELVGSGPAFAVSSCTAALELAAILSGVGPGDEVIIPAHTFAASAIPFARTGAKLVWADIDQDSWVSCASQIEPLINSRTKAVVLVHLYGLATPMDEIVSLLSGKDIFLIEDAAQAIGASCGGRAVGSFGDFSCFSFHGAKNISTLGEGGALVVKNQETASLVPGLRHNGMRAYEEPRDVYWKPAMTNVDFDLEGFWPYNFCIGEAQCALGTRLISRLESEIEFRKGRFQKFVSAFGEFEELVFQSVPSGCGHSHHLLPAKVSFSNDSNRDELIALLAADYSIKCVVQYCPLYRYPMFVKGGFSEANCPNTDEFFDSMISFPFHSWISEEDFEYLTEKCT